VSGTLRCLVCALALAGWAESANAREVYTGEAVGWEIAPFYGYRFGGDIDDSDSNTDVSLDLNNAPAYGVVFDFPSGHHTQWEIFYTRQQTSVDINGSLLSRESVDVDIEYLHAGGIYVMDGGKERPYVGFTLGATRFSPDGDYDNEVDFSVAFVGGVKFQLTRHLGLRLDARALGTLTDSQGEFACSGGCVARWNSQGFWQLETSIGLNFYL
jgi:hypothetical protein